MTAGFGVAKNGGGVGILSGARLTNEEFHLLKKLAGTLGSANLAPTVVLLGDNNEIKHPA